jgi:hypothetical protein
MLLSYTQQSENERYENDEVKEHALPVLLFPDEVPDEECCDGRAQKIIDDHDDGHRN